MAEELTLDGELDRQLKLVRRGEASTIVCPFCGAISNEGSEQCCDDLAEAKGRLSRLHIQSIERQVSGIRLGLRDESIECPYCGEINSPDNMWSPPDWKRPNISPYCCDLFFVAVTRLADRSVVQKQIDHKNRIDDNIARVQ